MITELTDENFEATVIQAAMPYVAIFTAEWCGPCLMIAPILEEIASRYGNQIGIGTLDIDAHGAVPTIYALKAVPTLMVFRDGEAIAAKMGALPAERIEEWLTEIGVL